MAILSVDLACKHYNDIGMVLLDDDPSGAKYELMPFENRQSGAPTPEHVADSIIEVSDRAGVSLILVDGPQAWKNPSNGLLHCRVCERALNAPAKTGLPGTTKPGNYLAFISFSIQVFDEFHSQGWPRYYPTTWCSGQSVAVETLPLSAWRSLGLPGLPAKSKASDSTIRAHYQLLVDEGLLASGGQTPSHDQLQALVAGLAGLGLMASSANRYEAVGVAPFVLDGTWREGYIVNPARDRSSV